MGRKKITTELFVYMNDIYVGLLEKLSSGLLRFTYDAAWINSKYSRPISLSMPLRESAYEGDIVYSFFDNLLPDNQQLRTRIQRRFNIGSNQCFDILAHIGADCVGAIQLLTQPIPVPLKKINAERVSDDDIYKIIKNHQDAPLGMRPSTNFRISIAGAQEKTAFLKHNGKWYLPNNDTPTTHIFKLPMGKIRHHGIDLSKSVENEWLCLQIISAFNLPVNDAKICRFHDVSILVCERFDRRWNADKTIIYRLPQEDMCQALGYSSEMKYESDGGPGIHDIMNFLRGSELANEDRIRFFKTCFVFWILGAIDGHAKNHSIFIQNQGRFKLTPVYDVISAYPLATEKQLAWSSLKMAMSVRGKRKHYHWNRIQMRHWYEIGEEAQLPQNTLTGIFEDVLDSLDAVINTVSERIPNSFPDSIATSIFNEMRNLKSKIHLS